MGLIDIPKEPSRGELRWFGVLVGAFLALLGWLAQRGFDAPGVARGLWIAAPCFAAVYYLVPPIRKPVYLAWMYAAFPIGWLVSHALLAIIYYLIITPIGLVMRGLGKDPMQKRFDPTRKSHWVKREATRDSARYFRQF